MDCSEDLVTVDMNTMTVHQMTTASILVPEAGAVPAAAARGSGGGGGGTSGGGGGADLGRRLLLAARLGDTHAVLELLARGAPFTTDWLGTSALHLAAINGHVETCAVLLRAGVSRDCRTKVDRTPLHLAAHAGHAAVAELLLEHHAAVDCRDMLQMTPLHWAVERGAAGVARALLAAGADPRARCKFRRTPLALAAADPHMLALLQAATHKATPATTPEAPPAPPAAPDVASEASPGEPSPPPEPIKINIERPLLDGESGAGAGAAAAMLRRHGITLLPADEGSTVLNALRCGRSVVLSDAGKLMLKESGEPGAAAAGGGGSTGSMSSTGSSAGGKGVLLTATPVRSPPRHGVKIFTLNNKLLTMPKENKAPTKKLINPHDSMQIQYIKLPSDAKLTPSKCVPMKAKNKQGAARPAVKLMMQKANLSRLTDNGDAPSPAAEGKARSDGNVLFVPEEFLTNSSPKYLRTQLLTAHKTIASLNAELSSLKARLSKYEKI